VRHNLKWEVALNKIDIQSVLPTLAQGLKETRHPFTFISIEGFKQLLLVDGVSTLVIPLLSQLVTSIKAAILSADIGCFDRGLVALSSLSDCVGSHLDSYIKILMSCLSRKISSDRSRKQQITAVLNKLEYNGSNQVLKIIKSKIPTYTSTYL